MNINRLVSVVFGFLWSIFSTISIIAQEPSTTIQNTNQLSKEIIIEAAPIKINIPKGYLFLNQKETLDLLKNVMEAPDESLEGVVGLLAPIEENNYLCLQQYPGLSLTNAGKFAIITYMEPGHVNDEGMDNFSFNKLLDKLSHQQININDWSWEPGYASKNHTLSLPLTIHNVKERYHSVRNFKFGNNGLILVESEFTDEDKEWQEKYLKDITDGIQFMPGYKYEDYKGDPRGAAYSSVPSFLYGVKNPNANKTDNFDTVDSSSSTFPGFWGMLKKFLSIISTVLLCIILTLVVIAGLSLLVLVVSKQNFKRKAASGDQHGSIKAQSVDVLSRIVIFICIHTAFIFFGIFLFLAALTLTILVAPYLALSLYTIAIGIFLICAVWSCFGGYAWFLLRPLFRGSKFSKKGRVEITRNEAPELFKILDDLTQRMQVKFPKKVFVSPDANAAVFFKPGFISLFFSSRQYLEIGLPLTLNTSVAELEAVLAHEFGHFSQNNTRLRMLEYKAITIIREIVHYDEYWENKFENWRDSGTTTWRVVSFVVIKLISLTRNLMDKLYRFVMKGQLSLSKLLEYEADSAGAMIAGKRPSISALCKIEIEGNRISEYNATLRNLISSKAKIITDYWKGYSIFTGLFAKIDGIELSSAVIAETPFMTLPKSRIDLKDAFNDHPSLENRIQNIKNTETPQVISDDSKPSSSLFPVDVFTQTSQEEFEILADLSNKGLENLEKISDEEFEQWLAVSLDERTFPKELRTFFNRDIIPFDVTALEVPSEAPDSPFNKENENFIIRYEQGLRDRGMLYDFKNGVLPEKKIIYEENLYKRKNAPIKEHEAYLLSIRPGVCDLDKNVATYALSKAKDKGQVKEAYENIFYAYNAIRFIGEQTGEARGDLIHTLSSKNPTTQEEFGWMVQKCRSFEALTKHAVDQLNIDILYPVIHADTVDIITKFMNTSMDFNYVIEATEINSMFQILDLLLSSFNDLIYYSKKIITDSILGKEPLLYWEGSEYERRMSK